MTKSLSEMSRSELIDEAVQLQQRNADLATHVDRLRLVAENMDYFNDSIDLGDAEIAASDAGDTLDEILARLKAEWQAEALERLIQVMRQPMHEGGRPWLIRVEDTQAMADELRQQAEGADQ